MDLETHTDVPSPGSEFIALGPCPEAEVEDHINAQPQDSLRRLPQKRLDRPVPGVVYVETGIIAIIVHVHSKQPDVPFVDGQSKRSMFGSELASHGRLATAGQSDHQVKCCHEDQRLLRVACPKWRKRTFPCRAGCV